MAAKTNSGIPGARRKVLVAPGMNEEKISTKERKKHYTEQVRTLWPG